MSVSVGVSVSVARVLGATLALFLWSASAGAEGPPCPATPSDPAAASRLARQLYDDASSREFADPSGALAGYRCAQKITDRAAIALRIGSVSERLELYADAIEAFEHYLMLAGAAAPDAGEMRLHIDALWQRVRERSDEQKQQQQQQQAAQDAATTAPRETTPPPKEAPARSHSGRTVGWILLASGAVAAIAGVTLLTLARSDSDAVHSLPAGTDWADSQARSRFERAKREQTLGIVAGAGGAVLAAAGLVFVAEF